MGDKFFTSNFNKYSDFNEFFDFVFYVNGNAFKVHQVVFAGEKKIIFRRNKSQSSLFSARSAFFAKLFKSNPKEFIIEDVNEYIFAEVIKYIYNDYADVNDNNERDLLIVAKKFELKGLQQQVHLYQNIKNSPMQKKELEHLRLKFDEAKYLYDKAKERLSIKNPFNHTPNRYY